MSYPLSEYLDVASPYLSANLVPSDALAQIRRLARRFSTVSGCGFECRLGDAERGADFSVVLTSEDAAGRSFGGDLSDATDEEARALWSRVDAVCAAMADPSLELGRDRGRVWIEFDVEPGAERIAAPGVCVLLNKARPAARRGMREVLARLLDAEATRAVEPQLDALWAALPDAARFHFIGAFPSRSRRLVNLNVTGLGPDQIAPFLEAIGWGGPVDEIARINAWLGRLVDRIGLSFNLLDGIDPRIGLECFIERSPRVDPRWRAFFDALVDDGLAAAEKRDALLAWHGFSQVDPAGVLRETTLARTLGQLESPMVGAFSRRVNHVKIVHQAGRALEAKAYFGIDHFIKPYPSAVRSRREALADAP